MNPYHSLTATCFWYAVSAEYYSYDFFNKRNTIDPAMEIMDKVSKIAMHLPNRLTKIEIKNGLLNFETEELAKAAV
jgi:hypothetical protein